MKNHKLNVDVLNNFLNIDLLNFSMIDHKDLKWSKKYIDKRHNAYSRKHRKNYYETKNYYMSKSDIQYSSVINMIKDFDKENSVTVTVLKTKNAFRKFQITISGDANYMLAQFENILNFEEKSNYLKAIENYYKIILQGDEDNYNDNYSKGAHIVGSIDVQFTLVNHDWCLDHIKTYEYISGNFIKSIKSYINHRTHYFYKGLFFIDDCYTASSINLPTQGLVLSRIDNNIHSSKLDSLNDKFDNNVNFHEYLYEDNIQEALDFISLVKY
jgi:hypothetical protein